MFICQYLIKPSKLKIKSKKVLHILNLIQNLSISLFRSPLEPIKNLKVVERLRFLSAIGKVDNFNGGVVVLSGRQSWSICHDGGLTE